MRRSKHEHRRAAIWLTLAICASTLSGACAPRYISAPLDPGLVSEIVDPGLSERSWQGVFEQSVRRGEALRRWNCRGYALRKELVPEGCR